MRTTARAGMALVAALAALAVVAATAHASAEDCPNGCVLLIEVNGLEPGDVSRERTPFLWALAHPNQSGTDDVEGAAYEAALGDRNGFMWQAARSPMTAGSGPAAASLLTGANPDVHGMVADEMLDLESEPTNPPVRRLRPPAEQDAAGGVATPIDQISARTSTLFELVSEQSEGAEPEVWAFFGDPSIGTLFSEDRPYLDRSWSPSAADGDASLCPLPRTAPDAGSAGASEAAALAQRACPARDARTLSAAFDAITRGTKTPRLMYIHLAELGRVKQLDGEPEAVSTLGQIDAALAAFIEGLSTHPNTRPGFRETLVVVTGNHGYEPTPLENRVPHPSDADGDFATFVSAQAPPGKAWFVGQGTIGTLYWPSATADELTALTGKIKGACECIEEVVPVSSLTQLHATWYLNPLTIDGVPSGAGGQLLVTTKPGWAFGRTTPGQVSDDATDTDRYAAEATNPYLASPGGPRNRAIALIMNGPKGGNQTVRQVENGQMWVKAGPDGSCGTQQGVEAEIANGPSKMADDANAPGHECQPETVDVAVSLAAMLNVPVGAQQAPQARFLNEAFTPPLGQKVVDDGPDEVIPDLEPPPEPEPIIIRSSALRVVPPRPPRDPFPYRGLVRRIRVAVTDSKGKRWTKARRGTRLSSIRVKADFGKPTSLVTLTFYKRLRQASGRPGGKLYAIARFKPFPVRRGPVELKLRIPSQFRPTHLGVSVREVRDGAPAGEPGGGIARIADANRLHRVKRGRR